MAGASKKAKRLALVRKITIFYPVFFVSNEHFGQDKWWAVAKLVRKPRRKVCQRSIERVRGLKEIFQRWMRADEVEFRRNSGSLVQQVFSHHWSTRLSAMKVWDIIENRAREAIVLGFSKPRTTFECIYTNPFTSKVSRGLDKPSPKLLGRDKPRLELAVGLLSRERRFCTIYTGCRVSRGIFFLVWTTLMSL